MTTTSPSAKNPSNSILQALIVILALGTIAFLIWEPTVEGRNVHATLFQIYFQDAFLAYAYLASIPFFVGLYHAFTALGRGTLSSPAVGASLRTIRACAIIQAVCGWGGEAFLFSTESDDRPPLIAMGTVATAACLATAAVATRLERHSRPA
jgi:hypothetical protein